MVVRLKLIVGSLLLGVVCFGAGYFVGQDTYVGPKHDLRSWRESVYTRYPNVQDAMRRWAAKDGISIDRAMSGRSIQMMYFPDRHCVQFKLPPGSAGGVPIYCYAVDTSDLVPKDTTKLIFEHSDVE